MCCCIGNTKGKTHIIIAMGAKKKKKVIAAFEHLSLSSQEKKILRKRGIFLNLIQDVVKNLPSRPRSGSHEAERLAFGVFTQHCAGALASAVGDLGGGRGCAGGRETSSLERKGERSETS